ncbi:MAG: hypothetical protein DRP87_08070 [Spirochaetes bacterium]|nr:MAG: hypothetical protein DRP87_08070 [Spirochaetota bacterium]
MTKGGTLFYNARFYSMRKEGEFFDAILVEDGKIKEVLKTSGSDNSESGNEFSPREGGSFPDLVMDSPGRLLSKKELSQIHAKRVDLGGSFVFPGFIDTHTHSFTGGLYTLGIDLSEARSLKEVLELLSGADPVGGNILAWRFDESKIAEKRFPTREELDRIYPHTPVLVRRVDGHSCVVNTPALESIPIDRKEVSGNRGILTHRQNHKAIRWFHDSIDPVGIISAYRAAAQKGVERGLTTIHTMVGNGHGDPLHYTLLISRIEEFPVEFIVYPQITDVRKAVELGSLRVGGCVLADGSLGSHTAALTEPYADRLDTRGELYHADSFWESFFRKAHDAGLQSAVHAIGDAAIIQVLGILRRLQLERPADLRHQIIHNELVPHDWMLDWMAEAEISAVMQPAFDLLWGGDEGYYSKVLGRERALKCNRLASLIKRGVLVTGGSDWYITPLDPLLGIEAAVKMHNPDERLSPYQAVELYTCKASSLSFDEKRLGMVLPEYQADLVCLEEDPLYSAKIDSIKVTMTVKKGNIVYRNSTEGNSTLR